VVLAGQVGVADHVTLGDGVIAAAQSGIPSDVAAGEKVFGTPARPVIQAKRIMVAETRLPELLRQVRALEKRLDELAARLDDDKKGHA
jgi:UDP-3-O-[3-hydroxymyristoyl] glucosamine N-acyltransferase